MRRSNSAAWCGRMMYRGLPRLVLVLTARSSPRLIQPRTFSALTRHWRANSTGVRPRPGRASGIAVALHHGLLAVAQPRLHLVEPETVCPFVAADRLREPLQSNPVSQRAVAHSAHGHDLPSRNQVCYQVGHTCALLLVHALPRMRRRDTAPRRYSDVTFPP